MTSIDTQLRTLAHGLVADAPSPPDLDELRSFVDERHAARPLRRGPLLAAAVAALLLLLLAGAALVRAEFGGGQSAPAPADQIPEVPEQPKYREATLDEQLQWCETASLTDLRANETGTQSWFDHVTRDVVELDAREVCRTKARTQPDPGGDMGGSWVAENGRLVVHYSERIRTVTTDAQGNRGESVTDGPPVSDEVAAQRVREYHERLDREAAADPSAQPSFPPV